MPSLTRGKAVAVLVGVLAGSITAPFAARAQEPVNRPHCLEELAQMSWPDLEQLYRASAPGPIPTGYTRGLPIYCPEERLAATRSALTRRLWHGKHFSPCDGTLVNQWCGIKAIRARVFCAESWLDGGPAIVMDYGGMSWVWNDVRDEIREVAPGLYLGAMFRRHDPQPKFKMFFALECSPSP
jgi:hypothetical protein